MSGVLPSTLLDLFQNHLQWSLRKLHLSEIFLAEFNMNENTMSSLTNMAPNATVITDDVVSEPTMNDQLHQPGDDDFSKFVSHPVLLCHFDWQAVSTGTITISQNLLRAYFDQAPSYLRDKMNNFYFLRAKLKLKFVVQGAPQSAGMLAFTAYPLPKCGAINDPGITPALQAYANHNTLPNSRICPHVLIDPSKSTTYELELPICTTTGYYEITSGNMPSTMPDRLGSWELVRRVIVPLLTGTSTTPVISVCAYMSLVDPVFVGLRQTIPLGPPLTEEKKPVGAYSSIARGVAKIAHFSGSVFPAISPVTNIFSNLSGAVGDALAYFGFSKPVAIENNLFVMNRTCDNYSQVDGISTALVMGRSQGQTVSISPEYIGGDNSDMSIERICSIPGLAGQFQIATTVPTQTYVAAIPVTPEWSLSDTNAITPLRGLNHVHKYWRGDMEYTFEFIASVFHRATILIAWTPDNASAPPPTFSTALTVLKNTTVYVSGNTTVHITVPYQQPFPAMDCDSIGFLDGSPGLNGRFWIYVVNPVQSNGSTDPIWVNVLTSSKNMKFIKPTSQNVNWKNQYLEYNEDSFDFTPAVVALGPPVDWVDTTSVDFGTSPGTDHVGSAIVGDVSVSVKDLISRMCQVTSMPTVTGNTLSVSSFPLVYGDGWNGSFLTWLLPAYLGSRGSIKLSYLSDSPNVAKLATAVNNNFYGISAEPAWTVTSLRNIVTKNAYAFSQTNLKVSSGVDISLPMTAKVNFYPGRNSGVAGAGVNNNMIKTTYKVYVGATPDEEYDFLVLYGAGDDFVLGGFIGFPVKIKP